MIFTPEMISTIGFPIAMTVYLMVRFEKKIDENTKTTQELVIFLKTRKK